MATVAHYAGAPLLAIPAVAALVYWIIVELWWQQNRLWRDAIMDTANVMCGAAIVAALPRDDLTALAVLAAWGGLLAFGVWRRL